MQVPDFRFEVPASLTVYGRGAEGLPLTQSFTERRFNVSVEFVPHNVPPFGAPAGESAISIGTIRCIASPAIPAVANPDDPTVVGLVVTFLNRVLGGLRNVGFIHTAKLIPLTAVANAEAARPYLIQFAVHSRVTRDGEWSPMHQATMNDRLVEVALARHRVRDPSPMPSGALPTERFIDACDAIEDGQAPAPDQEFYVNALEHVEAGNYRMAIVESVICLELCIAGWMNEWLRRRGVADQAIQSHFSKDVGIAARVAVMVPVLLHGQFHARYDSAAVLRLIKLRNGIAHKTGHVEGVPHEQLIALINEAMKLAVTATTHTKRLQATERLAAVQADVQRRCGTRPNIDFYPPRSYFAEFRYPGLASIPDPRTLEAAVNALGERLSADDRRFVAERDLEVSFAHANRGLGEWIEGTLRLNSE
jgi:hypothetical protein